MLISKFNRLIHNKILWALFAGLVSLSMFGLGASYLRGSGRRQQRIGELFGKPVAPYELQAARIGTRGFRPQTDMSTEQLKEIERQSWRRLALLRKAESMGITVTDTELAAMIQRDPTFQSNGAFNRNQYEQIIRAQLGIPVSFFETIVRQDITIQKLQRSLAPTLWISPDEVNDTLARLTDEFTCEIAVLDFDAIAPEVTLSDEEVTAYYDENQERFRTQETRAISFIQWPVSNYLAAAINEVEPDEIDSYYDSNMEEFSMTDTNGATIYQPLAEVTNQIRGTLAHRIALTKATDDAIDLSFDIDGDTTFDSVATAAGMTISTTAPFSVYGQIEGIPDVDTAFNATIFELALETEADRVAEPIPGTDNVYLPRLITINPAVIPPLAEIREDVQEQATDAARNKAFMTEADALREKLVEAVRAGTNFVDAAKALGCDTQMVAPFSPYQTGGAESDPIQSLVAREVIDLVPGELSGVISGFTGTYVAYVKGRTPTPFTMTEMLRPDVQQSIARYRGAVNFNTWADSILAEAGGMPDAELFDEE